MNINYIDKKANQSLIYQAVQRTENSITIIKEKITEIVVNEQIYRESTHQDLSGIISDIDDLKARVLEIETSGGGSGTTQSGSPGLVEDVDFRLNQIEPEYYEFELLNMNLELLDIDKQYPIYDESRVIIGYKIIKYIRDVTSPRLRYLELPGEIEFGANCFNLCPGLLSIHFSGNVKFISQPPRTPVFNTSNFVLFVNGTLDVSDLGTGFIPNWMKMNIIVLLPSGYGAPLSIFTGAKLIYSPNYCSLDVVEMFDQL